VALFLQKPVFWNTKNYAKPSGVRGTSGFPKENGFGHEEWNNSARLRFVRRGEAYRAFHTEEVGNAPVQSNFGQTFLFMTASHDGVQQLVGVAANAVSLIDSKPDREKIVAELQLQNLAADAWDVPLVRAQFEDKHEFNRLWKKDLHWIPNWICPEDYFMWLDKPVTLDPQALTGKKRLLSMYISHTTLDRGMAQLFMDSIPESMRDDRWARIVDAIQVAPSTPALAREVEKKGLFVTDVLTQTLARRGQGRFREDLFKVWGRACAVTRIDCSTILRASHIKPWSKSNTKERLDPENGLLLSANLDALFDSGLITFEDDGGMRVSDALGKQHRAALGLPKGLCQTPTLTQQKYLRHHREEVFERWK
jgi:hypothetical protein